MLTLTPMAVVRAVALYVLILFTTFYVGLSFFFLICPFDQHFDTVTYAKYFQIVDGYMGRRMPIVGGAWLLTLAINLAVFANTWRQSPIFWMILTCLLILVADMAFTGHEQTPINQDYQKMDMNHLTAKQTEALRRMRVQSDHNFGVRDVGQKTMYFMMSLTPFLLPGLNRRGAEARQVAARPAVAA